MELPRYICMDLTFNGQKLSLQKRKNNKDGNTYAAFVAGAGDIWEVLPVCGEKGVVRVRLLGVRSSIWTATTPYAEPWVLAKLDEKAAHTDPKSRFAVVPQDGGKSVALKCVGNNKFLKMCQIAYPEFDHCLIADEASVVALSKFNVTPIKEPFKCRNVCNVVYNTNGICPPYKEETKNVVLAEACATNKGCADMNAAVQLCYSDKKTQQWNNSVSPPLPSGPMCMDVGNCVPSAECDGLKMKPCSLKDVRWGQKFEQCDKVCVSHNVCVPPCKTVKLQLVATLAKFEVPFSYTESGTLSNGFCYSENNSDGVFLGSNYYGLDYKVCTC